MSVLAEIARAKEELKLWMRRALAQTFIYTLTAKGSALGDQDAVESSDEGRDPGSPATEKKSQRGVVRIQPFGFRGVPPAKLRGLTLRLGMSNLFFIGIGPTTAYGPQGLDVGEVAVYAKPGQTFVLDKNGNLIATPAGSGTVQLGGNAHPLPLWDTFENSLVTFFNMFAGTAPIAVAATGLPSPGLVSAANVILGLLNGGNFNSTKATNG